MSNGHICCLFGVCCPPGSQSQRESFIHLATTVGIGTEEASDLFDSLRAKGAAITTRAGADLVWQSAKAGLQAGRTGEEEGAKREGEAAEGTEPSDPEVHG